MERELRDHLSKFVSAPVLFVGSGVSRRFLGLPNWTGLLQYLAGLTGNDYGYYSSTAAGDPGQIATLMAPALHDYMWKPAQKPLRTKYQAHLTAPDSAIKILTAEFFRTSADVGFRTGRYAAEVELFSKVVVDALITTNYDALLEDLFPDYRTYVGQDELIFADPAGVGEIYHVHGAATQPNTLVLTHEDYAEYEERNPYLIAKLLTLFAEHPVFFVGYSLSDPNIIGTLTSLAACLTRQNIDKLRDRLIVVEWEEGATPSMTTTIVPVGHGVSIPVIRVVVPDYLALLTVLGSIERKLSGALLRQVKERLFELVRDNDPKAKIFVADLTHGRLADEVDVVFGVGAITAVKSYAPLERHDLVRDVLHDDRGFDPTEIVHRTLPALLRQAGNFPMAKYLQGAGCLDADGDVVDPSVDPRVRTRYEDGATRYLPTVSVRRQAAKAAAKAGTFSALVKNHSPDEVLSWFAALPSGKVRIDSLRSFLLAHEARYLDGSVQDSNYVKAVCLLDRKLHGPSPAWAPLPSVVGKR